MDSSSHHDSNQQDEACYSARNKLIIAITGINTAGQRMKISVFFQKSQEQSSHQRDTR